MSATKPSLPGSRLPFASAAMPVGCLLMALAVYLPPYLAADLGVSLAVIGTAWATVRLLDVVIDPLLGFAIDRTRARVGGYRIWLLASAPILMLAVHALFQAPAGIGSAYLVAWLLVFYLGLSILTITQSAWAAGLATDYDSRSRLFGLIQVSSVVGGVVVLIIPVAAQPAGLDMGEAVRFMGWFIVALTPVVIVLACVRTPEPRVVPEAGEHFGPRHVWALIRKPDLLRMALVQLTLTLGPGWMGSLYLFFFTASRGFSTQAASALLLGYVLAGVVGAPLTARAAVRFSKHRTLTAVTTLYALGLVLVMAVPRGSVFAVLPLLVLCGMMNAGFDLLIRAMLADVADEVRLEQGRDQAGLIYAFNSLANKLAAALAIGLTYPLLSWIGFNPAKGTVNPPEVIRGLELAYVIGPAFFVLLGGLSVVGWRLTPLRHAEIRRALDAGPAAGVADSLTSASDPAPIDAELALRRQERRPATGTAGAAASSSGVTTR